MGRRLTLLVATLGLAVAGAAVAAPRQPPSPDRALRGSTWRISLIDGAPVRSPRAELRFLPGRLVASAGCNTLGGPWRVAGRRLEGGPMVSTMMYCNGLMEQEGALAALLGDQPEITLAGNLLRLKSGKHSLEAARI